MMGPKTKITKYLEKNLNKLKEENCLCCWKQRILLKGRDAPVLIDIAVEYIKEGLKNTKELSKEEIKKVIKRMNEIKRINKILKLIPNVIWDKIEKATMDE